MKVSNSKGITLVSLAVTIIILIIIAGVTFSNVVGKNSTIDKAENVKLEEEKESKKDTLQFIITKYNSQNYVGSNNLVELLMKELELESVTTYNALNGKTNAVYFKNPKLYVKLDNQEFLVTIDENGIYYIEN